MKRVTFTTLTPFSRLLLGVFVGVVLACHEVSAAETVEQILQRARAVLAQVDGEIKLPRLREPVEVLRDRWGVPHIYAQNSHDLFFAQGFVVAQDRLFQLDWWRRVGCGETAEVLGESAIAGDRFARLMLYRGDMQAEWTSYAPDARDIALAFTQGINACIDHFGDRLPIEFQTLGYRPRKWRPEDVLTRMSGIIMVSNWQREVARARLIAQVGVERARLIAPTDPPRAFAPASGL
jgi:penicillin amidase